MFDRVKKMCGISQNVTVYDEEIEIYLEDCLRDMKASGVSEKLLAKTECNSGTVIAAAMYVKAYLGNDRTDTEKYLELYRKRVFRLTLEGDEDVE